MEFQEYEVFIAGAGPSGSTVALTMQKYRPESKILVIDKEQFPRHKLGEAILPGAFDTMNLIGVLDTVIDAGFPRKMGAYYFWGKSRESGFLLPSNNIVCENGVCRDTTPHMFSYHVERNKFDKILIDEAHKRGAEVRYEVTVKDIVWGEDKSIEYITLSDGTHIKAKFYVDASGIYSGFIPNHVKELTPLGDYFGNVAIHGYLKGAKFIHEFPGLDNYVATTVSSHLNYSWSWYIPVDRDLVSVGIVFNTKYNTRYLENPDQEQMMRDTLNEIPQIKEAIKDAEFVEYCGLKKISTVKNWNGFSKNVYGPNWFLAGDAAFFSDPILSSGVTMAMRGSYFLGVTLKEMLQRENEKWNQQLKVAYAENCEEIYSQVKNIIQFWYEGMDGNYDMQDLFKNGDDVVKSFGLMNKGKVQSSFMYVVNGLLQSLDVDDNGTFNGSYEQDDFEIMIKGITGHDIHLEAVNISDDDVFSYQKSFFIERKLRIDHGKIILGRRIRIDNHFKSSFFINDTTGFFLSKINGKRTFSEILDITFAGKKDKVEELKRMLYRLELLGLIKKMNVKVVISS